MQGGDISEQVVRDAMVVFEEMAKLGFAGGKEVIIFLVAMAKREKQVKGESSINHLLDYGRQTGQYPAFFQIKAADKDTFKQLAKQFGVLYHPIFLGKENSDMLDMVSLSGDEPAINRIFEKLGYPIPERDTGKNAGTRAASEPNLNERGNGYEQPSLTNDAPEMPRSTMEKIRHYTNASKQTAAEPDASAATEAQAVKPEQPQSTMDKIRNFQQGAKAPAPKKPKPKAKGPVPKGPVR
ncbi:PcfB family protein [Ruminococcaceae bacterium OttesenSCG-928-D13]|nr:PcfB family protein [Ruminococcaceae bacterium OttesenSCG-928-D13]